MARTIGQQEKGIILQEFADTRDIERDFQQDMEIPTRDPNGGRDSRPDPYIRIRGERLPNPEFIRQYPDAARNVFGFDVPALEQIVNDDNIVLTPEMVEVINDPQLRMTRNGEITRLTGRDVIRRSGQFANLALRVDLPENKPKKKRKPSKYQKELGKQLKMLKKKHPRTPVIRLMKRAHRATKKALKK